MSLIEPLTFLDLVEYSNLSHWSSVYVKTSGKLRGETLNVSVVIPKLYNFHCIHYQQT